MLPFKRFRTRGGLGRRHGARARDALDGRGDGHRRRLPDGVREVAGGGLRGGLPTAGTVFVSVADRDKRSIVFPVKRLVELGFDILATEGTASVLRRNGIPATVWSARPPRDTDPDGEPTIVDLITAGEVDMVVNTPSGQGARVDGYEIRTATTAADKPIVTTVQQFGAAVQAIEVVGHGPFSVTSLQEHDAARAAR